MKDSKLALAGLRNSAATVVYVVAVAWFMSSASAIFGDQKSLLMPVAFLLLFVVSALITGTLVLGQPILTFMQGKKTEALEIMAWTIAWLVIWTIIAITILAV